MITYKTDDSYFTFITPRLAGRHIDSVRAWFWQEPKAEKRFVYNQQLTITGAPLETVEKFYPRAKTIMVVVNPWRLWFEEFLDDSINNNKRAFHPNSREYPDFNAYLKSRLSVKKPPKSQLSQAQYTRDGKLYQSEFIFRVERLEIEFKVIQDYFESDIPLSLPKLSEYKDLYTDESRKLVDQCCAEDIARFGYRF
jgi:hypothetical protein